MYTMPERVRFILIAALAFAGFFLVRIGTDSDHFSAGPQVLALGIGCVSWVTSLVVLLRAGRTSAEAETAIPEPPVVTFLFGNARSAPLWLGIRLFLGYEWIEAAREKLGEDAWMSGAALRGFWQNAVQVPEQGHAPITYGWYREYIQFMLDRGWYTWFADLIAWGELLVGIGLVLGGLTGIAAFFGATMNMSFMLAGSASTNPVLFTLSILLILAWRVAGLIGLDRWLLPALGVPWQPGSVLRRRRATPGSHAGTMRSGLG